MTTLNRRKIGRTNLEVTELGLGGAPMGGFRATISGAEANALIDAAYDGGVRYFDTSPYYGYGRSELRMGAALREKPRDAYVLSTKIGRVIHAMKPSERHPADFRDNGLPGFAAEFDYSYDGVMRSLEHSHLRLGLARIDIALIHDVDFWTTKDRAILEERFKTVMDSGFKALDELRKAGVVGAIGVGINEADTSLRFIQAGDFDCMLLAGRYTLLEQGGLEAFLPECVKRNVSVVLGGPYNSGSRSFSRLSSLHSSTGIFADRRATFCFTSAALSAPGMTEHTAEWNSGNCMAAAPNSTPWRWHTASIYCAFSIRCAGAAT